MIKDSPFPFINTDSRFVDLNAAALPLKFDSMINDVNNMMNNLINDNGFVFGDDDRNKNENRNGDNNNNLFDIIFR